MQSKNHPSRFNNIHAYSCIFRHIHTYSGRFKHIQKLFEHIQAYSDPCVSLVYFEPLAYSEPEAYSEPWYIQNPKIFKTLSNI